MNQEQVNRYIARFPENLRPGIEQIIQLLEDNYIDKDTFVTALRASVRAAFETIGPTDDFYVFLRSVDPSANQGQSYMFNGAIGLDESNVPREYWANLKYAGPGGSFPTFTNPENDNKRNHILIVDDVSYSGSQHTDLLQQMVNSVLRTFFERCTRTPDDPPASDDDPNVYLLVYKYLFRTRSMIASRARLCFWVEHKIKNSEATEGFFYHDGSDLNLTSREMDKSLSDFLNTGIEKIRRSWREWDQLISGSDARVTTMSYRKMFNLIRGMQHSRAGLTYHVCVPFVTSGARKKFEESLEAFNTLSTDDGYSMVNVVMHPTGRELVSRDDMKPTDFRPETRELILRYGLVHNPHGVLDLGVIPSTFASTALKMPVIVSSIASPVLGCGMIPQIDEVFVPFFRRVMIRIMPLRYGTMGDFMCFLDKEPLPEADTVKRCAIEILLLTLGMFCDEEFEFPLFSGEGILMMRIRDVFDALPSVTKLTSAETLKWTKAGRPENMRRVKGLLLDKLDEISNIHPEAFRYFRMNLRRIREHYANEDWVFLAPHGYLIYSEFMGPLVNPSFSRRHTNPVENDLARDFLTEPDSELQDYAPCQNVWKPVYKWVPADFQSADIFKSTRFGSRRRAHKIQSFPAFYRMYIQKHGSRPVSYVYSKYMAARVNAM